MIYLVVGIDHASLAPWHENISAARTWPVPRAAPSSAPRRRGVDLVVAAVIGPDSTVLRASRERAGRGRARPDEAGD